MTPAQQDELRQLETRMGAILDGYRDPEFGSEQAARLCELKVVRYRHDLADAVERAGFTSTAQRLREGHHG